MRTIAPEALAALLRTRPRTFALFDIREAGEAEQGHIPGATFLPRREIEFRIDRLVSAGATPLILYGEEDGRTELAAGTLARLGYGDVVILAGGVAAWTAGGHPLASGVNVPSKRFGEHVLEEDRVASISPDALDDMRAADAPVLQWDVRTPAEFARASLPGSVSRPGLEIVHEAADAAASGRPVVVHCAGRTRSIIAARTLTLLGVTQAVALENGTMGWRLSGRSLSPGGGRSLPEGGRVERAFALATEAGARALAARDAEAALAARGDRNCVVLDIRAQEEHLAGHVPGAVPFPGGQLLQCTDEALAVEAARVILVDDGDGRAAMAAYWLRRMGYPDIAYLEGGLTAWRAAGFPVVAGPDPEPEALVRLRAEVPAVAAGRLDGVRILDVGTSRAFKAGHVPGARWLPRGWLEARARDVLADGKRVVVTASDEGQAILATATLRALGYDAACLEAGNAGFVRAGGSLEPASELPIALPPDVVDPPYAKGEAGMRRYLEWEIALTA